MFQIKGFIYHLSASCAESSNFDVTGGFTTNGESHH